MRPISGSAAGGATSDLAITAGGQTLDFYLSPKRNVAAAKRFLAKALKSNASAGYDYPPDAEKEAIELVLEQAEVFASTTTG